MFISFTTLLWEKPREFYLLCCWFSDVRSLTRYVREFVLCFVINLLTKIFVETFVQGINLEFKLLIKLWFYFKNLICIRARCRAQLQHVRNALQNQCIVLESGSNRNNATQPLRPRCALVTCYCLNCSALEYGPTRGDSDISVTRLVCSKINLTIDNNLKNANINAKDKS